jgi:hypothetical protein
MRDLISRWQNSLKTLNEDNANRVEDVPARWVPWAIFLVSALGLYFEMVMVRWHATSAHVFAIFKNVSLLSCFLGLGIGFALARQKRAISLASFVPLLAIQIVLFGIISVTIGGNKVNPVAEQLVMGLQQEKWSWLHPIVGNLFLATIFVLNATMFIPVGYTTGRLMTRMDPLPAYSLNLLGALAGIGLFFGLSWIWSPPTVWMAGVVLLSAPLLVVSQRSSMLIVCSLTAAFLTLGLTGRLNSRTYYSPYQVVALNLPRTTAEFAVPVVRVNHSFYQDILDLRPESVARDKDLAIVRDYYDLPYKIQTTPGHTCIVGAGTGNDVAAALRAGATKVTAVEIDPAIQFLGKSIHPERPYQNPKTVPVLCDARTFIRQTDQRFDTVVYGLLDSHTNLGAMTNVRLDSFVYTLEGFQEAVSRLTDNGLLVVSYLTMDDSQADKLYAMLSKAYPASPPATLRSTKGYTFVTGPGLAKANFSNVGEMADVGDVLKARMPGVDIATDDWPQFYMQKRSYPVTYMVMVLALLGLSVFMVKKHVGALHLTTPRNGVFFFLGAGFMLLETKIITELGLTFGNTWAVIGIAIMGVLVMAYLANLWISRGGKASIPVSVGLLTLTLAAGLFLPKLGLTFVGSQYIAGAILVAPLFFAGLIFSQLLKGSNGLGDALAANLFGGMLGGFLEYNSMYWGLSSLYPLGFGLYAMAMVCRWIDQKRMNRLGQVDDVWRGTQRAA